MGRPAALGACLLLTACDPGKPVTAECGVPSGGISNPDYAFMEANWSCAADPIATPYDVNVDSFALAGLASADVIADMEFAALAWSTTGAQLEIAVGDVASTADEAVYDYESQVFMVSGPDPTDPTRAGVTRWTAENDVMVDCDMLIWTVAGGVTINWQANGVPAADEMDLGYTVAHEMGHCVGLADQTAGSTVDDLMFASQSSGQDFTKLSSDEVEAAIFLYGSL